MNKLKTFESYGIREIVFTHKNNPSLLIKVSVEDSRIKSIKHLRMDGRKEIEIGPVVRFPFSIGQSLSRNIEVWACNNNFYMDGKDTCPEKRIFGIRVSDVPSGHEWRHIFPNKFR
jgi:hypothetical protein